MKRIGLTPLRVDGYEMVFAQQGVQNQGSTQVDRSYCFLIQLGSKSCGDMGLEGDRKGFRGSQDTLLDII
jgi:hypothetical protein